MKIVDARVAVILTSYNKPEFLRRAIRSVLDQTLEAFSLIIAEDNSPNKEVWDVIRSFTDDRIVAFDSYVSDQDRFKTARYATQINAAVRNYTNSKYLCYLADDDFYYPPMLKTMVDFADEYGHDAVFCAQDMVTISGILNGVRWYDTPIVNGYNLLDHNQVMTTRRLFDMVGGWDDDPGYWSGADAYFFNKISRYGVLFHPIGTKEPLQAKVYREHSVQWNVFSGLPPTAESR